MSTLNDNLLQIYNTKLEIKDAIGTNSDVFAEYPDLIRGIKNGIVPTGTLSYAVPVDMYGPYVADVTSYSYVSVSLGESSAYIYANGEYTPADFGYAAINTNIVVNVPGPSGNMVIEESGNYNVSSYASVTVDMIDISGTYTITNDGLYDISSYAYVNVHAEPNLLVNAWSGDTVDASSEDLVYEDIDNLLQQTLLYGLQASVDSIDSIIGAQWTSVITPGEWLDCGKNEGVKVYIDENASAGGYESSTGWLRIIFTTPANGLIRIKFTGKASNSYHTQEQFETNWITFEFYRGA